MKTIESKFKEIIAAGRELAPSEIPPVPVARLRNDLDVVRKLNAQLRAVPQDLWVKILPSPSAGERAAAALYGGAAAAGMAIAQSPRAGIAADIEASRESLERLFYGFVRRKGSEELELVPVSLDHDPLPSGGILSITLKILTPAKEGEHYNVTLLSVEDQSILSLAVETLQDPNEFTSLNFEWADAEEMLKSWWEGSRKTEDLPFRLLLTPTN